MKGLLNLSKMQNCLNCTVQALVRLHQTVQVLTQRLQGLNGGSCRAHRSRLQRSEAVHPARVADLTLDTISETRTNRDRPHRT